MDQPKQERTLTLLYLLGGNRRLTFKDLMDGLGLSRRSLHRYLATLKGRNLLVEEYPMAAARVWADGDFWFWDGDKLRAWLAARVEQMRVKFMPLPPLPVQV